MIVFKDVKTCNKGCQLIVDVATDTSYTGIYIDKIIIDNQDTFNVNGPSSNPIYEYDVTNEVRVYTSENTTDPVQTEGGDTVLIDAGNSKTQFKLTVNVNEIALKHGIKSFDEHMLFIYVRIGGTPTPIPECGQDKEYSLNVLYDKQRLYNLTMYYIKELNRTCQVPKGFIDILLRLKAITIAIKTGHYIEAIKFWNLFFLKKREPSNINCGCNG